jgi:hypothetical protein
MWLSAARQVPSQIHALRLTPTTKCILERLSANALMHIAIAYCTVPVSNSLIHLQNMARPTHFVWGTWGGNGEECAPSRTR